VNILKNALETAGSRIELARGVDRKVLGHRHPGAVTELRRAWGDGDDGALGRVLAEGCSRRYSEVAPDTPV
jgi:hypothetical protein